MRALNRGQVIAVSGVDCSGKSTQIGLLAKDLAQRGAEVTIVWYRPGYSRRLDRLRSVVRRLSPRALPTAGEARRDRAFRRPGLRRIWVTLALADAIVEYGIGLRGALRRGNVVVCDRYVDDALLDLDLRFPELAPSNWVLGRWLRRLAPDPDAAILLTLPWDDVLARADQKREPFPEAIEARKLRFCYYEQLAGSGRFATVDSSAGEDEVLASVLAVVNDALERR